MRGGGGGEGEIASMCVKGRGLQGQDTTSVDVHVFMHVLGSD